MPGIDKTEKYYRVRQKDPEDFQENSFRIVPLSKEKGIYSVQGKLKNENTMTIQSLLFDVKKWTETEVREWIKEHGYKILFNISNDINLSEKKDGLYWIDYAYETDVRAHPNYAPFSITSEMLMDFIKNFKSGIPGLKDADGNYVLPVTIDHGADPKYGDDAVAWIKDFKLHYRDGVYVLLAGVEFVSDAFAEAIKNGTRKFFSPTFREEYVDAESGKKYKNVALGGSFTNYPTLKKLEPVSLNDLNLKIYDGKEENTMDEIKMLMEKNAKLEAEKSELEKKLADYAEVEKKLSEASGKIAELEKKLSEIAEEKKKLETERFEAEIKLLCEKAIAEKKVAPAMADFEKKQGWFFELCTKDIVLAKKTLAELPKMLSEKVGSSISDESGDGKVLSPEKFDAKAKELCAKEKIEYFEAVKRLENQGFSVKYGKKEE